MARIKIGSVDDYVSGKWGADKRPTINELAYLDDI